MSATATQDKGDLVTEQTRDREEQGGEGPFSQQVTRLSRKRMSGLYSGGRGGLLAKNGPPVGSVPQNGVMLMVLQGLNAPKASEAKVACNQ